MDAQSITAICAVLIALSALFVAVWQARATRIHNRLSVKPHLNINRTVSTTNSYVQLDMKNNGIGPAFIQEFELQVDGNKIQPNDVAEINEMLNRLGFPGGEIAGHAPRPGTSIGAGESKLIFKVTPSEIQSYQDLLNSISRIKVIIKYKSIYGEKFKNKLGH